MMIRNEVTIKHTVKISKNLLLCSLDATILMDVNLVDPAVEFCRITLTANVVSDFSVESTDDLFDPIPVG